MIKEALHKVINNEDLTYEEALETMKEIMTGEASQIQMAAFLTALRMKGETITEITACAKGMRAVGTHLQPKKEVLEIVGTGGDEGRRSARRDGYGIFVRTEISFGNEKCRTGS